MNALFGPSCCIYEMPKQQHRQFMNEAFDAFQQDDAQPEVQVRVGVWFEIVFKFRLAF